MKSEKNLFFFNKKNFLFFKIFLWLCAGLTYSYFSILIPATSNNFIEVLIVFASLAIVINFNISYVYQIISKKSKVIYFSLLACSIFFCAVLEIFLFSKNINDIYSFLDKRIMYLFLFTYITIRNFFLFFIFFWIEYFYRLYHLYLEKETIHKKEIALIIEKQEFEKKFSRKKLLPHYFFNVLEHICLEIVTNNNYSELINKMKFVLYYFLVDGEKEIIELDKELAFYQYYIELEKVRHKKDISVCFNVLGQPDKFFIIPLLFEPIINNALKYTKRDGTGWVEILIDAQSFPVLKFYCKNNYVSHLQNTASSESGLKIFEQRLELCYKNKHDLTITYDHEFYEVQLMVEIE